MLVGRDEERAEIEALLEGARRGRSGVLVLMGEAGIGKSALLAGAREAAVGMRVLEASGVESESDLPYAALHALLRPVLDGIDALPERQRRALAAALALEDADEPDRLAMSAGALTLLDDVAERQPLLVLLDDAHWVDRESAEAIAFVARRMAGIELAILAAVRMGETSAFDFDELPTRVLEPLSDEQSLVLLEQRHGATIESGAARRLVALSGGNPLALIEIPETLTREQLDGREPLPEPLPVTARIEQAYLRRVGRLPEETRISLVVAAAGADVPADAIREAAAVLGGGSLAPAESASLLYVERDRVRFAHPLLRSAVYHSAEPSLRRRAHEALAAALEDKPDLRAWQLAAGADGPDEATAAALEATAERVIARGGHAGRARALERAADLSPDPVDRGRRMCEAAQAAFWSGDGPRAIALCERALPLVDDPLVRADLVQQLAAVAGWQASATTLPDVLRAAERVEDLDADRAVKLLMAHLTSRWSTLDYTDTDVVGDRIAALLDRLGPWWLPRALGTLAEARAALGDAEQAHELYDRMLATDLVGAASFAESLVGNERYEDARRALTASLELGRSDGNPLRVAYCQGILAILELALGDLERARVLASDALGLARAIDVDFLVFVDHVTLATLDAVQGRDDACRENVAAVVDRVPPDRIQDIALSARTALGLLETSRGRFEQALATLEPIHERVAASGLQEVWRYPYAPNLVEAYARLGRTDDARAVLHTFEELAQRAGSRWGLATSARCRGLLAPAAELDSAFELALARHADVPSPFELARTELVYGERLRRANRRRDARPRLRAALDVFDAVGATPWSERASAELRATGERLPPREESDVGRLTPQELQIATLVAEGLTNREIGAQVFLSPKTVEYHLTHVYRKLDLHSRAELIRQFAGQSPELEVASS